MWTAIALIAIAGMITGARRRKYQGHVDSETVEKIELLEKRLDQLDHELRERVEVLERIVTDSKSDLKRQFDYLDKAS
jgi:hypothetical protein